MRALEYIRRKVFCITQAEMAKIAGTTQATVSRWETGELEPDREQLRRIRDEAIHQEKSWDDGLFFAPAPAPQPEKQVA